MDSSLKWAEWIFSWPTAVVVITFAFRQQFARWLQTVTEFKLGRIRITRQLEAVAKAGESTLDSVSQMIILLGESRVTELRVTLKTVGVVFEKEDQKKMQQQINDIEVLLKKVEEIRGSSQ
jgi:hypothetical protein